MVGSPCNCVRARECSEGDSDSLSPSQVPPRECHQLHLKLEGRAGLQCPHPQAQVGGTAAGTGVAVALGDVPQVCHSCLVPSVPRPELVDFQNLTKSNARHNLEHAFSVAERHLGITPLLDPEGEAVAVSPPASVSPGTFPGSMKHREVPNTRKEGLGGHRRGLRGLWGLRGGLRLGQE